MHQQKCYELLGLERNGDPDTEMTIGSLSTAIVQSIDFRLTHTTERIEEFKVCLLSSGYSLLLKREDELLFLTVEDGYLEVSGNGKHLFGFLSAEGRLRDVADDAVVTELERLRAQVVANQLLDAKKRELAERDRLIVKYGMPSTGIKA